jgi:excinuclease ABC subunit A
MPSWLFTYWRLMILPHHQGSQGEYHKVFEDARKAGFVRVRVDYRLDPKRTSPRSLQDAQHRGCRDRLSGGPDAEDRRCPSASSDSVETALWLGGGRAGRLGGGC